MRNHERTLSKLALALYINATGKRYFDYSRIQPWRLMQAKQTEPRLSLLLQLLPPLRPNRERFCRCYLLLWKAKPTARHATFY